MNQIEELTRDFFSKHWDKATHHPEPKWKKGWNWEGSVPYHNLGGVYALLGGNSEILYIGVATAKGRSLAKRICSHVIRPDKKRGNGFYQPKPKWTAVNSISAVGLPKDYTYLAAALEVYLIERINPPMNKNKKTKS
jgi:hypothetical protein